MKRSRRDREKPRLFERNNVFTRASKARAKGFLAQIRAAEIQRRYRWLSACVAACVYVSSVGAAARTGFRGAQMGSRYGRY